MLGTDKKSWYVLRAIFHKEEKVRDMLRHDGFRCFVPMEYRIVTENGHKVRRLLPAITELVFVYATEEAIKDFKFHSKDTIYWLTKPCGNKREKIVVPDKAMEDFILVVQKNERSVTFFRPDELNLNKGDHIQIHGGIFDGVEGVLLKVNGKREKQLVISIPGITAAAVSIRPDIVEVVSKKVEPSRNMQADSRELIWLSTRMLTSAPDPLSQSMEYDMLHQEICRLYESLRTLKGYVPSAEGELSLSLLMAEHALGEKVHDTEQRYLRALALQKQQSLLQVRMLYIGGILLKRQDLLDQAQQSIAIWKSNGPSNRQAEIISETSLFVR